MTDGQGELFSGSRHDRPAKRVDALQVPTEDHKRLTRQAREILARLRIGRVTNVELSSIALKYTNRISEIRAAGYNVEAERGGGGVWTYTLRTQHGGK